MLPIFGVIPRHPVLIDRDAKAGLVDAAPARAIGDRDLLGENVVRHHLRRLLVAEPDIGRSQHCVLAGGSG